MLGMGLDYLSLDRPAHGLSVARASGIACTQIGAGLTGVPYVPRDQSIGLAQRDNDRLLATLFKLRHLRQHPRSWVEPRPGHDPR